MPVKCIYSVCSALPLGGVGGIAYHAMKELNKRGMLKKGMFLNINAGGKIPNTSKFYFPPKPPFLPVEIYYTIRNNIFDYFVAGSIKDCDVFHGWIGHGMKSFEKAKGKKIKTVTNGASLHPMDQNKILVEEYKKYNIKESPLSLKTVDKYVKELRNVDFIAASCDISKESFIQNGYPEENVYEVPFGVDTKKYTPGKKSDDVFRTIFIGTVGFRKGPQYTLEAWKQLKLNGELTMLGPIEGAIKPFLKKYKNERTVKWIKWSNDLKKMCNESSIFVLPALEEGGTTLAQLTAMACGLPCIVTNATYFPIRDGKEGFIIEERNVKQIKDSILYFKDNPSEIKRMGRNSRKRAEKFTWEKYGEKLAKMYKEIV